MQPALSPVSGGMPLPVTTHTIFDSSPVMPSSADLSSSGQVGGMPGTTVAPAAPSDVDPLATSMMTAGVSGLDTDPPPAVLPAAVAVLPWTLSLAL